MKKEVLVTGSKRDAADAGTTPGDGAPVGVASVKYSVLRSNVVRVVLSGEKSLFFSHFGDGVGTLRGFLPFFSHVPSPRSGFRAVIG